MLFFILEIIYPRVPGAIAPQDFLKTALPEDILSLYAKYLVNLCIWIGGILALAGLIYGGVLYLLSTGKPQRMASAKDQITAAFFGLLLLFSSFLILKTLSPQFINLKIPTLQEVQIPQKPIIPLPETTAINSSIDVEMPFGRIIEKIFETYISEYPEPKDPIEPRMLRIKNISRAIIGEDKDKGLADKLKDQSQALKEAADKCSCRQTDPDPACGGNQSGDTTWKCDCGSCSDKEICTCDPCKKVRTDIQKTEEENLKAIYKGTEIVQFDEKKQKKKITTNLIEEQIKTEKEVALLKDWLERLKRAEKFILECPKRSLSSLAQFYSKKDYFDSQKWLIRETKFWDDINIRYYTGKYTKDQYGSWYYVPTKEIATDFATFYCSQSGTTGQQPSYAEPNLTGEETVEESEQVLSESMACSKEAPVGEIIDRSKRTAQLLINKLEQLVGKEKELIEAVDKLEGLVSQCSSQRGCERRCTCFPCGCGDDPCINLCQGWIYCCADSSSAYPGDCLERDEDTPCPYEEIEKQVKETQKIWQEIKDLINGKKKNEEEMNKEETPEEKVEKMGIIPLIDEIIPEILNDLEWQVRKPMKECSSEDWSEQTKSLFNCIQTMGAIKPEGAVVYNCCRTDSNPYGDCFKECYLEKGQEKHRKCVQTCLDKKSQELNDPELPLCTHELNFYCCP